MKAETKQYLSTSELSRAAGVGRETLRYYEEEGILKPESRTAAGYRRYSTRAVDEIDFIKQTQRAGFSIREIKALFKLRATNKDTCGALSTVLSEKLAEIESALGAMQARRAALLTLSKTCGEQSAEQLCGFVRNGSTCC